MNLFESLLALTFVAAALLKLSNRFGIPYELRIQRDLGAVRPQSQPQTDRIHEGDWNDALEPVPGLLIHVLPARHYSGRMLTGNKTLWVAFALETSQRRLFFSGDSGYGPHFREIGERFGGFDLVALDMGQYDKRWANIHMFSEQAAQDLRAKALLPAQVGRFTIAAHGWDEPLNQIDRASQGRPYRLPTPNIGALVLLDDETQQFPRWWKRAVSKA